MVRTQKMPRASPTFSTRTFWVGSVAHCITACYALVLRCFWFMARDDSLVLQTRDKNRLFNKNDLHVGV